MKKLLLLISAIIQTLAFTTRGETINLRGTEYEATTLIQRDLGSGVTYQRLRIGEYPLNVNLLIVDMKNPYARIETTQASETIGKTESLEAASARLTAPGHKVLGGTNANFWCVANQPPHSSLLIGTTYGANVKNGEVITETNMYSDQWVGGWQNSGVAAVDINNKAYIANLAFYSTITAPSIGSQEIIQVNKVCRDNEIAMYNHFYGTSKKFMPVIQTASNSFEIVDGVSTEVLCDIDPDQALLCAKDITLTVKEVRKDAGCGTLGNHDIAFVGKGGQKETLAKLQPGDKVTLNYAWSTGVKGAGVKPQIENAVSGCSMLMIGGQLTPLNEDGGAYNDRIYSRTGYGTNQDGDKLVAIVIDMSTDPVYGHSAGCNTKVMCDILKHYGCTEAVMMDAGGSAEMLVEGSIINRTTEGNPRAVANGWLMVSTAPEDNTVARLEFDSYTLEAPIYSSFRPVIIAYNKYGDIISHDFQEVELSCEAKLGSCNGNMFTAAGEPYTGMLTASYNGVKVSKQMEVKQAAALAIRIKPILIDATRKYPIEVTASIGDKVYTYNPADLDWSVDDPSVVSIENGILTGLKNGSTSITGTIGDFSDKTDVTVEIAPEPRMPITDFSSWTAKGMTGITKVSITPEGVLNFTYGSPRGPKVTLTSSHTFFSLPDRIVLTFTPSVTISEIKPKIKAKDGSDIAKRITETFEANKEHTVELKVDADLNDLINYPLTLSELVFYITTSTAWKGEQNIRINNLYAEYNNPAGVESVTTGNDGSDLYVAVNPTAAVSGQPMNISSDASISSIEIFSISGAMVSRAVANSTSATVNAPAGKGIFLVKVATDAGVKVVKISVK